MGQGRTKDICLMWGIFPHSGRRDTYYQIFRSGPDIAPDNDALSNEWRNKSVIREARRESHQIDLCSYTDSFILLKMSFFLKSCRAITKGRAAVFYLIPFIDGLYHLSHRSLHSRKRRSRNDVVADIQFFDLFYPGYGGHVPVGETVPGCDLQSQIACQSR